MLAGICLLLNTLIKMINVRLKFSLYLLFLGIFPQTFELKIGVYATRLEKTLGTGKCLK